MRPRAGIAIACAAIGLAAGCGTSPPSRFYTLGPTAAPAASTSTLVVAVGPVTIPAVVDRPEFVVNTGPNEVKIDDFNRWAAPLQDGLSRAVAENLVALLGTPRVVRFVLGQPEPWRRTGVIVLFLSGGVALYFTASPFLDSMKGLATTMGVSTFVFVQWVAPFLSEMPEKTSAFYWARSRNKAGMALMNMASSNVNQWTVLAAMIPIVAPTFAAASPRPVSQASPRPPRRCRASCSSSAIAAHILPPAPPPEERPAGKAKRR